MIVFYQVAFWILVVVVAWLVLAVINLNAAYEGQNEINKSVVDCLHALKEYVEKLKGATK